VRQLVQRDGTDCGICGYEVDVEADAKDDLRPSIDHVIPRCAGGSDGAENLQLTHLWCNLTKNWRKDQPSPLGPARLRYIAEKVSQRV
jgi:5-methylcytosine-specific restriction endonuclease McrA